MSFDHGCHINKTPIKIQDKFNEKYLHNSNGSS